MHYNDLSSGTLAGQLLLIKSSEFGDEVSIGFTNIFNNNRFCSTDTLSLVLQTTDNL